MRLAILAVLLSGATTAIAGINRKLEKADKPYPAKYHGIGSFQPATRGQQDEKCNSQQAKVDARFCYKAGVAVCDPDDWIYVVKQCRVEPGQYAGCESVEYDGWNISTCDAVKKAKEWGGYILEERYGARGDSEVL